jgi:hypothetical protein
MYWRRPLAVSIAACLWLAAGEAIAQAVPPLRGAVDDEAPPPQGLATTTLAIAPVEEAPPIRGRAAVDPYAPTGIETGGIAFYPSLFVGGVVTSNVQQASSDAEADVGLRLRPQVRFESDWVRHAWSGNAGADVVHYADRGDLKTADADIFGAFRLDIRRHTRAEFEAGYVLDQEGLGDSEVPAAAVGFRTDHQAFASASLAHDFGPIETRIGAGAHWNKFGDVKLAGGSREDNADRDYVEWPLSLRATYIDPPAVRPFVQASYLPRRYRHRRDRNGFERSSQGYAAAVGAVVAGDPVWSGDLALTYLWRDYDDPALAGNDVLGLDGSLTWRPSDVTSVALAFETSLDDTIASTEPSERNWFVGVDLVHALRDNLELAAGTGLDIEKTADGTDRTYEARLGIDWRFNPVLSWTAGYDVTWLDAANSRRSYTEHRVSAGLTLRR